MKNHPERKYLAFLLRLWQEDETTGWRVTLENPHDGKRYGFSNLKNLFAYLEDKTGNQVRKEIENDY
jgi:hypothetical protein